jgi:GMP synthase (glutamine-hydrolysing)
MAKRIVLVSHAAPAKDDRASDQLAKLGYQLDWITPCEGEVLGPLDKEVAGTIVYGGKYCISDIPDLPFMQQEIRWLQACMDAGLPVLGICQGAQMIAHILGAEVGPPDHGQHEFGYYPIEPTPEGADFLPETLWMTQFHFHEFQIPKGAIRLAQTETYANQAFSYGKNIYGVQFHPEVTRTGLDRWHSLDEANFLKPGAQARDVQNKLAAQHEAAMDVWFRGFLDKLFGQATA